METEFKFTDSTVINLSRQDAEIVLDAIKNPPKPNEALIKAHENYKKFKETK